MSDAIVCWSFATLQEMFDWVDAGDFQKSLDSVVHVDEEE